MFVQAVGVFVHAFCSRSNASFVYLFLSKRSSFLFMSCHKGLFHMGSISPVSGFFLCVLSVGKTISDTSRLCFLFLKVGPTLLSFASKESF